MARQAVCRRHAQTVGGVQTYGSGTDPTTVRRNVSGRANKATLTGTATGYDHSFEHTVVANPRSIAVLGLERIRLENVYDVSFLRCPPLPRTPPYSPAIEKPPHHDSTVLVLFSVPVMRCALRIEGRLCPVSSSVLRISLIIWSVPIYISIRVSVHIFDSEMVPGSVPHQQSEYCTTFTLGEQRYIIHWLYP